MEYDPLSDPDPESWLALDELERMEVVRQHHAEAGVELPNPTAHAMMHTIVENQLAMGVDHVRETLDRLQNEGLDRHEALHAISSVLLKWIWGTARGEQIDNSPEGYYRI